MSDINLEVDEYENFDSDEELNFDEEFDFDEELYDPYYSLGSGIPENIDKFLINANIATFNTEFGYSLRYPKNYGTLHDAAIAIKDGKIAWLGSNFTVIQYLEDQASEGKTTEVYDTAWKWVTPGLIDCHTGIVFVGNHRDDFEAKLHGKSEVEIAKEGGGLLHTVKLTREASEAELYNESEKRLQSLLTEGVTSLEIKSGYGLNLATEEKILRVAKKLSDDYGVYIQKTYFAASKLPLEYHNRADEYIEDVCQWLRVLHDKGLVDAVDGRADEFGFTTSQIEKLFEVACELDLPVKLHSEQVRNLLESGTNCCSASSLIAYYGGLSSDHLVYSSDDDISKIAESYTSAVLLPYTNFAKQQDTKPPVDTMRKYGVDIAISTGSNAGSAPLTSILTAMNMACHWYGLTPAEALIGTTRNAAKALGLCNKGVISVGMDADLVVWDIERPTDLSYFVGQRPLSKLMVNGIWLK